MQLVIEIGECLFDRDRQFVGTDFVQVLFVSLDKSLFYMAMASQHRDCGVKPVDVVRHFHSSVFRYF